MVLGGLRRARACRTPYNEDIVCIVTVYRDGIVYIVTFCKGYRVYPHILQGISCTWHTL